MPLPESVRKRLEAHRLNPTGPMPKSGEAIFNGLDYPRTWDGFIGQESVKEQLIAAGLAAASENRRLDHILLASGLHGIGKTTLAYLLAYTLNRQIMCVSGPLSVDDARSALRNMDDGGIFFWDEFHLAVTGSRTRADWTLPFLTDGVLMTAQGAEQMPNVSVVAATTDAGRLPRTVLSRFMVRPKLEAYTADEAALIVEQLSERMNIGVLPEEVAPIARAANNNPRDVRMILTALRNVSYTPGSDERIDLDKVFDWAGLTYDGIDSVGQDILLLLLASKDYTASIDTIQSQLGEPGPLRHHEQLLLQKGLLTVGGRGRSLTDEGVERAQELARDA